MKQLKDIYKILGKLKKCEEIFLSFRENGIKSPLLKKIAMINEIDHEELIMKPIESMFDMEGLPQISDLIDYLRSQIVYDIDENGYL